MCESERAMDDIVEVFLVEKLNEDINNARKGAVARGLQSQCNQLISILDECEKICTQMKENTRPGPAVKETRREKLYYLLNVIADWHEQSKKLQPTTLLSVGDISRKLNQVKKDLEDAQQRDSVHSAQPSPEGPQVYRWSCHAMNLAKTHGFDDKRRIMERLLLNPNKASKAVGIVGVAGVGKTALCQQAYNYPPVQEHFLLRIWLCLSKPHKGAPVLSFEDHLKMMLSCLGFEDQAIQNIPDEKLQLVLRRQLNRGTYLIVLDDVWTVKKNDKVEVEEEIQKLFRFLNDPNLSRYQGTLILTSRSPELEQMVGANNIHRLLPLADDDSCWNVFTDAFKEGELPEELENLKPNILDKCAGLPLMAKMLGKIGHVEYKKSPHSETTQETTTPPTTTYQ